MPHLARFLLLLLAVMSSSEASLHASAPSPDPRPTSAPAWKNPIVRQRADPWVTRDEQGRYLLIATVPEYDRIEIRRAESLAGLEAAQAAVIWRKPASGPASHHIWAPELHRINNRWYIYFAGGRADDIWAIRMYVLECVDADPLTGTWTQRGQLRTEWESFSLDATTFELKGQRYLVWAQHDPKLGGNTSLFIAKMDTPWSITGRQVRITHPELPWEVIGYKVNEGPAVLHRNGRLFLTYSASATDANYCVGMLTAKDDADPLDPKSWVKSQTPVLKTSDEAKVFGPGHNGFTTLPDGTDVLIYHARDYKDIKGDPLNNPDRHTRASIIRWAADGTPLFSFGL